METFYLNALLREALGVKGNYEYVKYDREITKMWLERYVIKDTSTVFAGNNEVFSKLTSNDLEVHKIVISDKFGRAERFARKHEKILQVEYLQNKSRAASIIASINQMILYWFMKIRFVSPYLRILDELERRDP